MCWIKTWLALRAPWTPWSEILIKIAFKYQEISFIPHFDFVIDKLSLLNTPGLSEKSPGGS